MLHKLIFDTTDANTIADSHSVGAFLRASDGTLLTHTAVGAKKALDVNIAEGINVEVDLSHVDDSVKIGDGTDFLLINTDGSLNITDNGGSLTVDAVLLDIRNLTFARDKVDATGSVVALDATTLAALESITVQNGAGAAAVNIQDGGNSITVDGSVSITGTVTVNDAALANTAIAAAANALAVANTAQDLVASPLANRKYLFAYNNGNRTAYVGQSGVSAANGFPVPPGSMMSMRAGAAIDIEWVSALATHDMRTLQLS